jgi:hypothetical protein
MSLKKIPIFTKSSGIARAPSNKQWHAVSVVGGPGACAAVRKLGPKRFLADEAPRFPLPECSSAWHCKCIYRHFPDRRAGPRRAEERNGLLGPRIGGERRETHGRRANDSTDL